MPTSARDIMTTELIVAHPEMTIEEAIKTLVNNRITGMPVVDTSHKLVGVVSEYDIIKSIEGVDREKPLNLQRKIDYTHEATTVSEDATLPQILTHFVENRVRRLPVLNRPACSSGSSRDGTSCACSSIAQKRCEAEAGHRKRCGAPRRSRRGAVIRRRRAACGPEQASQAGTPSYRARPFEVAPLDEAVFAEIVALNRLATELAGELALVGQAELSRKLAANPRHGGLLPRFFPSKMAAQAALADSAADARNEGAAELEQRLAQLRLENATLRTRSAQLGGLDELRRLRRETALCAESSRSSESSSPGSRPRGGLRSKSPRARSVFRPWRPLSRDSSMGTDPKTEELLAQIRALEYETPASPV